MHLTVLAFDLDGTLTQTDRVADSTWRLLRQARSRGFTMILVTGRVMETFAAEGPFAELCEAIVAEDGAVVYFPRNDNVTLPFGRLAPALVHRLERLDIPLERGMALLATHVPHDKAILQLLQETGGGATVEYNRGAVMVLPPGATKGTGLQYALRELGYSTHNVIACGDAENDRSLFETAELAVAVANASPDIQRLADAVLAHPNGQGVEVLLAGLLQGTLPQRRLRPERRLYLGKKRSGASVYLDPFVLINQNLGITGSSHSGKSWLAGLLAEEMLKLGYQICIVDPEGDYGNLRAFPKTLLMGGSESPLPPVLDLVTLCEYSEVSLILDLSGTPSHDRLHYVSELIEGLSNLRARRSRPHWLLIDELQGFCPADGGALTDSFCSATTRGGFTLVSYRLSEVAPRVLDRIDNWLLTRLDEPDQIGILQRLMSTGKKEPRKGIPALLTNLPVGQAFMCLDCKGFPSPPVHDVVQFRAAPRRMPHVRHLHKYLKVPLPDEKRFYFRSPSGSTLASAASLWEFRQAIEEIPLDSIRYHLERGDFERWLREVMRDAELSRRMQKLSRRNLPGENLRQVIQSLVTDRYEELEALV